MKKIIPLLTLSLVIAAAGCDHLLPPAEMSGALEVVVTDQDDQPLAKVPVAIWFSDGRKRSGETDKDGMYLQEHLVRGSYRVEVAGQSESCFVQEREVTQCPFVVGDS